MNDDDYSLCLEDMASVDDICSQSVEAICDGFKNYRYKIIDGAYYYETA